MEIGLILFHSYDPPPVARQTTPNHTGSPPVYEKYCCTVIYDNVDSFW